MFPPPQVASTTAGLTIGTSPYDDSLKRKKKGVAVAVNRPAIATYVPHLHTESRTFLRDLLVHGQAGHHPLDPLPYIQRLSLSLAVTINWGVRIPSVDDPLFQEIVAVEEELNRFRSTTGNLQDYIPLLRLNPINGASARAREMRDRRDAYLAKLNGDLAAQVAQGTHAPCIQANVLQYKEAALNDVERTSISLSMLGGGFETVSTTVQWSVGYLAQHPEVQEAAVRAIRAFQQGDRNKGDDDDDDDDDVEPLGDAADEQRCAYINALAKEALRYFTVIPLNLPRETIRDTEYEGQWIPKGTTVYMNAEACNWGMFFVVIQREVCFFLLTFVTRLQPLGRSSRVSSRTMAGQARGAAVYVWSGLSHVRRTLAGGEGGVPHLYAAAGEFRDQAPWRGQHGPKNGLQEPRGSHYCAAPLSSVLCAEERDQVEGRVVEQGRRVDVHTVVDRGMHRQGC